MDEGCGNEMASSVILVWKERRAHGRKQIHFFLSQLSRPNCLYGPRVYSCYLWVSLAVNVMDGGIHRIAFLFLGARGRSWDWIDIVVALLSIRAKKCRISLLWLKRGGVADY